VGQRPKRDVDSEGYGGGWGYGSIGSEDSGYFADVSEEEEGEEGCMDAWGGLDADRARLEARRGGYEPCLGVLGSMRV